jgi:AraC family transcriptional regulator
MQNGELPALWERYAQDLNALASTTPSVFYGLTLGFDSASMTIDYLAAAPVAPEAIVPEGMVRWEVPASHYAVFDCTLATLSETIMGAYSTWLPGSDQQRGDGPEFERYDEKFDLPEKPLTFWLPIHAGT